MLRSLISDKLLSNLANLSIQQTRNTFILKRRFPVRLHKMNQKAPRLRSKNFVYETVRITDTEKHPKIKVILTNYIEGIGDVGDIVDLGPYESYRKVLLPQAGVYCTPENLKKYVTERVQGQKAKKFSSPYVEKTLRQLHDISLPVIVSYYNEWKLEPWHVKVAFRNHGFHVPDYAITLPEQPITGPNVELEEKEFYVTVTVNQTESTPVRCRIWHYAIGNEKRDMPLDFVNVPREPLFLEQAETLASIPLPKYVPPVVDSKFGLPRRRVPRRMKAYHYVRDLSEKNYYEDISREYNKK